MIHFGRPSNCDCKFRLLFVAFTDRARWRRFRRSRRLHIWIPHSVRDFRKADCRPHDHCPSVMYLVKLKAAMFIPQKTVRNSHGTGRATREGNLAVGVLLFIATSIPFLAGCSVGPSGRAGFVYVPVPDTSLRYRAPPSSTPPALT